MLEQNSISQEEEKLHETLAALRLENSARSARALEQLWRQRARPLWRSCRELYQLLGQRLRELGENFLAIEVAREGLTWFPGDPPLVHTLALAHARAGAPAQAREILTALDARDGDDDGDDARAADPAGRVLLARTHRELFFSAETTAARREHLRVARTLYHEAFRRAATHTAAVGGNAAAMALLDGDLPGARELARQARELCFQDDGDVGSSSDDDSTRSEAETKPGRYDAYRQQAILAQCSLIEGDFAQAESEFRALPALLAGRGWTRLVTTRRQVRVLLDKLAQTHGNDPRHAGPTAVEIRALHETLDSYLTPPRVMLFAGHMIDLPTRATPRFPAAREAWMRAEIDRQLAQANIGFGFSSAACGSDIVFLEALLARGGEAHIVLPFGREEFRRRSVVRAPEHAGWGERFDRVLDAAATFAELSDSFCLSEENAVNYANRVLHGRALWRAVEFDTDLRALAAWDGRQEGDRSSVGGRGCTWDCLQQWRAHDCPVEIISLAPMDDDNAEVGGRMLLSASPLDGGGFVGAMAKKQGENGRRIDEAIRATLCGEWAPPASARLRSERRRLAARRAFFARVAQILEPFNAGLLDLSVEGDRFRLLFAELVPAAQAARALRAGLAAAAAGSSRRFALRLGLHAGPVARMENALLGGHAEPVGTHWQKAERLASLAARGRIILSREAAALLAVETQSRDREDGDNWHCEYQGRGTFGEPFGRQGIYAL